MSNPIEKSIYQHTKMKSYLIFLSFFALASATLRERFEQWLTEFKIDVEQIKNTYGKDVEGCFHTWVDNEKFIIEHNLSNSTYKLGHNKFSCLNSDEFSRFMGFGKVGERKVRRLQSEQPDTKFPESFDWRNNGAVTDVKDQKTCGSCWSFSSTGALEGAYQIKTGTLKSFSEQQLVSCSNRKNRENPSTNMGCNGGMMDESFLWIEKNDGLCSEQDYPYVSGDTQESEDCVKTCTEDPKSDVQSYVDVTPNSDNALMSALLVSPVSIAIQANQPKFQLYKSGVLKGSDCGDDLDHGVLVVGWGVEDVTDYWIVKNSWSESWGLDGYIKLERNTDANNGTGTCGILSIPSYPVL